MWEQGPVVLCEVGELFCFCQRPLKTLRPVSRHYSLQLASINGKTKKELLLRPLRRLPSLVAVTPVVFHAIEVCDGFKIQNGAFIFIGCLSDFPNSAQGFFTFYVV